MTEHTKDYFDLLENRLVIFDGAMGTSISSMRLSADDFGGEQLVGCNDHLNLSCPDAPRAVHASFLDAGVDVIETNTFRANRLTLAEFGIGEKCEAINLAGAQIAREIADAFSTSEHPRFVAGTMGPTGKLLSLDVDHQNRVTFDAISDVYRQQAGALIAGGVDLLLIETAQDLLEVKAAIHGILTAFQESGRKLPIQAQVTLDTNGFMLTGTDIAAVITALDGIAIDILGINCSTGPEHMETPIQVLSERSRLPVSCLPNAGLPSNSNGEAVYPLSPEDFAQWMTHFVDEYGVSIVGGCCGTRPEHLRALVERIGERRTREPRIKAITPSLSSAFHSFPLNQEPRPFIIGERLNTQGSRLFKRLMLTDDFASAMEIAKEQSYGGAHALDICTALTEKGDEAVRMEKLVRLTAQSVDLPLVIDSTEPHVMERALRAAPGKCLLNSINLESGEEKAKEVLSLARRFNAAVIALTIDDAGMARTAERKLAIARSIFNLAVEEYGLAPSDLVFDPLTFTLASGSAEIADSAVQTLEAIWQLKNEFPVTYTVLGVSNISFGLKGASRRVLTSVFLNHALQAGLDMAILNPADILPYREIKQHEKNLAEDLIFNRQQDALERYIACFEDKKEPVNNSGKKGEILPLEERIAGHILERHKNGLEADLDEFVLRDSREAENALEALNTILLPAMKRVGEQFGKGELILPFVLQSAEVMRAATDHLEGYLEKSGKTSMGTIVLATVYGDVHDIGKNLVKTILSNNGWKVLDLGKQVPAEVIANQAAENNADAVGLSALLVSTSQQMPLVVKQLHQRGLNIPVLIGGAAVNEALAKRTAKIDENTSYDGGVYYCEDAFEAMAVLERKKAQFIS